MLKPNSHFMARVRATGVLNVAGDMIVTMSCDQCVVIALLEAVGMYVFDFRAKDRPISMSGKMNGYHGACKSAREESEPTLMARRIGLGSISVGDSIPIRVEVSKPGVCTVSPRLKSFRQAVDSRWD
jgi:hypothetical protein